MPAPPGRAQCSSPATPLRRVSRAHLAPSLLGRPRAAKPRSLPQNSTTTRVMARSNKDGPGVSCGSPARFCPGLCTLPKAPGHHYLSTLAVFLLCRNEQLRVPSCRFHRPSRVMALHVALAAGRQQRRGRGQRQVVLLVLGPEDAPCTTMNQFIDD